MAVSYGPLTAAEEPAAIEWWAAAFGDDPTIIATAFRSDPRRLDRSFAARGPDGVLCAAITYWARHLRDAAGAPRATAHLWGVGTPGDAADAKRQGHVDRLLTLAFEAARAEGCEIGLLYPAPETFAHYERAGWRLFPSLYRQGVYSGARPSAEESYTIRPYDPAREEGGWERLAAVYEAYNASRPASVVRDLSYWRGYLSWRWGEWSSLGVSPILLAAPAGAPSAVYGYAIPRYYNDTFIIAEVGALPGHGAALPALVAGAIEEATRRGVAHHFRIYLPREPQIDAWADALFTPAPQEGAAMSHAVYRLSAGLTDAELAAMFAAPGGHSWLLDQF